MAVEYPSGDGKPLAETPVHRDNLLGTIELLRTWFAGEPEVYISGNMFVYYVEGNPRKHVVPDVFVVRGVARRDRDYYLVWEERKGPEFIVEMTSRSTRREDMEGKFHLYQDVLKVSEYFLFDPRAEYLDPRLRGYRLQRGRYGLIRPVKGRLPSKVLGLHLEANGQELRLYDPATGQWVPTARESLAQAEEVLLREAAARQEAEAEVERLRRELDALRSRRPEQP
ncbi:MAG TPA: Uma2 family endonuclease [Gemmataceae bacterium]|nr:Uma2 family endonuclease [Gemmataceae bacterium]